MKRQKAPMTDTLRAALDALIAMLKEIEQHCPCGARPESPATHPHVITCPVERALHLAAVLQGSASLPTPTTPDLDALVEKLNNLPVSRTRSQHRRS